MRILAAHQPAFIPWLPFWDKVNKADVFVILIHCQYEKNNWQNRCQVNGKYWTKPVQQGSELIKEKQYVDGQGLVPTNIAWIIAIARTLGIDTQKIQMDYPTEFKSTERLTDICTHFECDTYLTNPDAKNKYLDTSVFDKSKINIIDHKFSPKIHIFEAFDKFGVQGTINLLNKEKETWKASLNSLNT